MTGFSNWLEHFSRRARSGRPAAMQASARPWSAAAPADPTQPLWLVPAYQRRLRSGDRVVQR